MDNKLKISLYLWCMDNGEFGNQLINEWVGKDKDGNSINMQDVSYYSYDQLNWKCSKCGTIWLASVYSRTTSRLDCPNCRKNDTDLGVKRKSTLQQFCDLHGNVGKRIQKIWTGLDENNKSVDINEISDKSNLIMQWKCEHGHMFKRPIKDITIGRTSCSVCKQLLREQREKMINDKRKQREKQRKENIAEKERKDKIKEEKQMLRDQKDLNKIILMLQREKRIEKQINKQSVILDEKDEQEIREKAEYILQKMKESDEHRIREIKQMRLQEKEKIAENKEMEERKDDNIFKDSIDVNEITRIMKIKQEEYDMQEEEYKEQEEKYRKKQEEYEKEQEKRMIEAENKRLETLKNSINTTKLGKIIKDKQYKEKILSLSEKALNILKELDESEIVKVLDLNTDEMQVLLQFDIPNIKNILNLPVFYRCKLLSLNKPTIEHLMKLDKLQMTGLLSLSSAQGLIRLMQFNDKEIQRILKYIKLDAYTSKKNKSLINDIIVKLNNNEISKLLSLSDMQIYEILRMNIDEIHKGLKQICNEKDNEGKLNNNFTSPEEIDMKQERNKERERIRQLEAIREQQKAEEREKRRQAEKMEKEKKAQEKAEHERIKQAEKIRTAQEREKIGIDRREYNNKIKMNRKMALLDWCNLTPYGKKVLSEWQGIASNGEKIDISSITWNSAETVKWKCENGHWWADTIGHRTKVKTRCPYCK